MSSRSDECIKMSIASTQNIDAYPELTLPMLIIIIQSQARRHSHRQQNLIRAP